MKIAKALMFLTASGLLSACASLDAQDRFVLGEASRANIASQSDRDVNLPNSRKVESTSGVRAVNAVKALNDGQTKELAGTGTGGTE
ncbi:MAG: hypothetical protein FP825_16055 [Hyphomonas sp.]|uniref:hypothetical protein n=1 Tax=Hyphomonas sp. TaxID=87 RepID=UPI0017DF73A1|nr:hypothetical protein [Hyphomonas sp.]MBA3069985.1 hypothetical protein [Hyphomonas sp.]MBU4060439.1 hypothetical protein [Alphaproteobacteria bacterium]MBU4163107.1 hypothetical protein [Alphaproteobacteria bacterium]